MKRLKSHFADFPDAVLVGARQSMEEEIKVRLRKCEIEYNERMQRARTASERAKLNYLMDVRRAQFAAELVAIKLIDEIIEKRERNINAEVTWVDNEEIRFVEEPRHA